jgi:GNAT superfamily N-acetyltransferase
MELVIRPVEKADLPGVLHLYAQPDLDNGVILTLPEAEAILERMQRYPNYHVYVAVAGGEIVGAFELLIMDNLGHLGAPSGVVEDVAVAPGRQGQGIGKAMIQVAWQRCQEAGCYKMLLSSNLKRTQAHAFYESIGFEKHGYSFWVNKEAGF